MLEKFQGRALSSITEQEVAELPEHEQKVLIEWALKTKLEHLIAEGLIEVSIDNKQNKLYNICDSMIW